MLVGPSARYGDDGDYCGGFKQNQITELLDFLADNYMGWSRTMAPAIIGNADAPELAEELTNSFCRTDPDIAKAFARVTYTSDNRADLPKVQARTLISSAARTSSRRPKVARVCASPRPRQRDKISRGHG